MTHPTLDTVFEYLALLISERKPEEPFLLGQLQAAITYKFPGFALTDYELNTLREFLAAGEQAGYFRLVNTGDVKTAHLVPGPKRRSPDLPDTGKLAANDPRRMQWMNELMEELLNAERADQIVSLIANTEALTPAFDAFLASREPTMPLYAVRGKLRRLRQFLAAYRERGETQAVAGWQPSRAVLRMPPVPPIRDAARASSIIHALMQGEVELGKIPLEVLNNLFFAVMRFYRLQLARERAWDYVAGLDILEAEARAVPRPAPQTQAQRRGLFGGAANPGAQGVEPLDDALIEAAAQQLIKEAGLRATQDDTPIWQAYVAAESLDASLRFLEEHPALLKNDRLLTWLEAEISRGVEAGDMHRVRALANKSAMLIAARQNGPAQVRQQSGQLREIYESIMAGARLLEMVFIYLRMHTPAQALHYLQQNSVLLEDETVSDLLDDQLLRAAREADVAQYRRVSERIDLWRNVAELGMENGPQQHARYVNTPRSDRTVMTEMGLLLLPRAETAEEKREILERYASVATPEGLAMITATLDVLSFRNADPDEYRNHFEVKRLIERCLEIGIDRALAELK